MQNWDNIKKDADKNNQIFAFLLYNAQSGGILEYVKNYSQDICAIAGTSCKIFMIAHPPKGFVTDKSNWFAEYNHGTDALDEKLGLFPTSYNPSNNYEVARALGVSYEQFPCIVFFRDFGSKDVIICRLPEYVFDKDKAKDLDLNKVILGRFEGVFSAMLFSENDEKEIHLRTNVRQDGRDFRGMLNGSPGQIKELDGMNQEREKQRV